MLEKLPAHNFMCHENPTHLRVFVLPFIYNRLRETKHFSFNFIIKKKIMYNIFFFLTDQLRY